MDQGYGSPVHPGYGSGPYVLGCSHMCNDKHNVHVCTYKYIYTVVKHCSYIIATAVVAFSGDKKGDRSAPRGFLSR